MGFTGFIKEAKPLYFETLIVVEVYIWSYQNIKNFDQQIKPNIYSLRIYLLFTLIREPIVPPGSKLFT